MQPSTPIDYESRADPAPRWRRRTVVKTVGSLLLLLLLISLFLPALNRRGNDGHSNAGQCRSNLRQIGLAMQLYAYGHRGRLPPDFATLILAEDLAGDVFVCRSTADERAVGPTTQAMLAEFAKPGHCSYVLASPLPQTWSAVTPGHVLAYEPAGNHYGAGANVLFGDGRCEFVSDARAAHLIAELNAGFNPPRKK